MFSVVQSPKLVYMNDDSVRARSNNRRELSRSSASSTGSVADVLVESGTSSETRKKRKTALITGANTGIGFETAIALLKKEYKIIACCRDLKKMESAKVQMLERLGNDKEDKNGLLIEIESLDLGDLQSIESCAKKILDSTNESIDVIINNAGVMATPEMETKDGFEYQLGVNHLGHFKLTNMLLPKLIASNDKDARIVCVSSEAHRFGKLSKDDLFYKKSGSYNNWKSYGQSKLANVLFANELQKKLREEKGIDYVAVNSLHPGAVNTELGRYLYDMDSKPKWYEEIIFNIIRQTMKTPAQGAETSVYLASDINANEFRGKYFDNCEEKIPTKSARNEEDAKWLWQRSAELTGVDFFA
jgi:NAD(P)-dependent dehydrogenase (short-subunit alcohol dehydrogenase family)